MDLYIATDGAHWGQNTNWLKGDPCANSWVHVGCTSGLVTGMYERIDLLLYLALAHPFEY